MTSNTADMFVRRRRLYSRGRNIMCMSTMVRMRDHEHEHEQNNTGVANHDCNFHTTMITIKMMMVVSALMVALLRMMPRLLLFVPLLLLTMTTMICWIFVSP